MIVLDVETSGLYPNTHSIVSMGAVDYDNPENTFYEECKIWDGAEISDFALTVNGFTKEQITDSQKQTLEEAVIKYIKWSEDIEDKTIVGENPTFDRGFLEASIKKYGLDYKVGRRVVDIHALSYSHQKGRGLNPPIDDFGYSSTSLNKTLEYVGLETEPEPHNALTGAIYEAEAYSRLVEGKAKFKQFEKFPIPEHLSK